jgi:hypothetical protein
MANVTQETFDRTTKYLMRKIAEQEVRIGQLAEAMGLEMPAKDKGESKGK